MTFQGRMGSKLVLLGVVLLLLEVPLVALLLSSDWIAPKAWLLAIIAPPAAIWSLVRGLRGRSLRAVFDEQGVALNEARIPWSSITSAEEQESKLKVRPFRQLKLTGAGQTIELSSELFQPADYDKMREFVGARLPVKYTELTS